MHRRLTPEERDEYEALVRVGNFVAIFASQSSSALLGMENREGYKEKDIECLT
jgi:hypothetical protein